MKTALNAIVLCCANAIIKAVQYCLHGLSWTTYFVIMYTMALFANGYYGYHFDTNDILFAYGVIAGKNVISHGINSALNSPRNVMPKQNRIEIDEEEPAKAPSHKEEK